MAGWTMPHRQKTSDSAVERSETPPGENQNLFAKITVRTYVWIVPDWTLQQSTDLKELMRLMKKEGWTYKIYIL